MDPNATVAEMRELSRRILAEDIEKASDPFLQKGPSVKDAVDLAARFAVLDEWLSQGGFLPRGWGTAADAVAEEN